MAGSGPGGVSLGQRAVTLLTTLAYIIGTLSILGAASGQADFPPFPVNYSGDILIQGEPAPEGLLVLACVAGCETGWEGSENLGESVRTQSDGSYEGVLVFPPSEDFFDEEITFWIVTDFGKRIQADQTSIYNPGAPNTFLTRTLDLTFDDPLPEPPTPTPQPTATATVAPTATLVLPIPGDADVPTLFRWALIAGAAALVLGGVTFFWFHRRRTI